MPNYYFQIVGGEVKLNNDKGSMAIKELGQLKVFQRHSNILMHSSLG